MIFNLLNKTPLKNNSSEIGAMIIAENISMRKIKGLLEPFTTSNKGKEIEFISDFNPTNFLHVLPSVFNGNMNAYIFCNKELFPINIKEKLFPSFIFPFLGFSMYSATKVRRKSYICNERNLNNPNYARKENHIR